MVRLGFALGLLALAAACAGKDVGANPDGAPDAGVDAGRPDAGMASDAGMAPDATVAEALERYTLQPLALDQPYVPGMDLRVDNVKGDIRLVPGESGTVVATFEPFTYRGPGKDAEAIQDIENGLVTDVRTEGNQIVVETLQVGGTDEVGATLTVAVPPEFDGALQVLNRSLGNVDEANIDAEPGAVASAFAVHLESQGLGDCDLDGTPLIVDTVVSCRGQIEITNVSDDVTAYSDGIISDADPFAIRVQFAAISAAATGGEIESTEGHVELDLPPEGDFQITATPNANGALNVGTPPASCELAATSLSCGAGGAIFSVSAGTDDSFGAGHVNISFN